MTTRARRRRRRAALAALGVVEVLVLLAGVLVVPAVRFRSYAADVTAALRDEGLTGGRTLSTERTGPPCRPSDLLRARTVWIVDAVDDEVTRQVETVLYQQPEAGDEALERLALALVSCGSARDGRRLLSYTDVATVDGALTYRIDVIDLDAPGRPYSTLAVRVDVLGDCLVYVTHQRTDLALDVEPVRRVGAAVARAATAQDRC